MALMKNNPASSGPERRPVPPQGPARKSVLIPVGLIGLGALALLVFASRHSKTEPPPAAGNAVRSKPVSEAPAAPPIAERPPSIPLPGPAGDSPPDRDAMARQLVKSLSEMDLRPGQLTPEKTDKWNRELEQLMQQGTAAVPPLQEFFESHADVRFEPGSTNVLGEPSLRIAFLHVLFNVPTPDNVTLQEEVLRSTTDPEEVAVLASQLEAQEPGKYRDLIASTAQASLNQAKAGAWPGRNTAPLFKIVAQYANTHPK
jgi:hypothetical protein